MGCGFSVGGGVERGETVVGGRHGVTDMHGHDLDFSQGLEMIKNQGIVAGNVGVHERVLETLKKMEQQQR